MHLDKSLKRLIAYSAYQMKIILRRNHIEPKLIIRDLTYIPWDCSRSQWHNDKRLLTTIQTFSAWKTDQQMTLCWQRNVELIIWRVQLVTDTDDACCTTTYFNWSLQQNINEFWNL